MGALYEQLEREFCPPLDSSLLAALVHEIEHDHNGSATKPSQAQVDALREQLSQIARDADTEATQMLSDLQLTTPDGSLNGSTTTSTPNYSFGGDATSSSSDVSQTYSFETPLGFLQAAFPHIPTQRLRRALIDAEYGTVEGEEADIWPVVSSVLSEEYIRELEERGLEESPSGDDPRSWRTVESGRSGKKAGKQKKAHLEKYTFGDVRQRQAQANAAIVKNASNFVLQDPWAQLSSLATHIASLLPPHTSSFFLSYFHRPQHKTPHAALCAALTDVTKLLPSGDTPDYGPILIMMLDILLPSYDDVTSEQLVSDSELALRAAQGRGEDALDLVKILRDLDSSSEIGFYHQEVAQPSQAAILTNGSAPPPPLRVSAPPAFPPTPSQPRVTASPPRKPVPNTGQWQKVQKHRRRDDFNYSSGPARIPTYAKDVNGSQVPDARQSRVGAAGGGSYQGKSGKGDLGELQRRAKESMQRRDEMLRSASRMWQRGTGGGKKGYAGGEVALYFAEKAKEYQEMARRDELDIARLTIQAKQRDKDTIDLHGYTAAESIYIIRELLALSPPRPDGKFKIITGRGSHSVNNVSVLKPALYKALIEDGWLVGEWDAGLTVRPR